MNLCYLDQNAKGLYVHSELLFLLTLFKTCLKRHRNRIIFCFKRLYFENVNAYFALYFFFRLKYSAYICQHKRLFRMLCLLIFIA